MDDEDLLYSTTSEPVQVVQQDDKYLALECNVTTNQDGIEWTKDNQIFDVDEYNSYAFIAPCNNYDLECTFLFVLSLMKNYTGHTGLYRCADHYWAVVEIMNEQNQKIMSAVSMDPEIGEYISKINMPLQNIITQLPPSFNFEISYLDLLKILFKNILRIKNYFHILYESVPKDDKIVIVLTAIFTYILYIIINITVTELRLAAEIYARIAYILYEDDYKFIDIKERLRMLCKIKLKERSTLMKQFIRLSRGKAQRFKTARIKKEPKIVFLKNLYPSGKIKKLNRK